MWSSIQIYGSKNQHLPKRIGAPGRIKLPRTLWLPQCLLLNVLSNTLTDLWPCYCMAPLIVSQAVLLFITPTCKRHYVWPLASQMIQVRNYIIQTYSQGETPKPLHCKTMADLTHSVGAFTFFSKNLMNCF